MATHRRRRTERPACAPRPRPRSLADARPPPSPSRARDATSRLTSAPGGHTLARHVGKTDEELRERLQRERGISAASTWTDRETAARVIGAAPGRAASRVARWTDRTSGCPNLALDWRGAETIGRSLARGARAPVDVACAVVVLRWDVRRDGYYVLTSYLEVCR